MQRMRSWKSRFTLSVMPCPEPHAASQQRVRHGLEEWPHHLRQLRESPMPAYLGIAFSRPGRLVRQSKTQRGGKSVTNPTMWAACSSGVDFGT